LKRWTLPLVPFLLLLLFSVAAEAQTTTPINPAVCVHPQNCVLADANGDMVWSDLQWSSTSNSWGGFLEFGKYPNQQELTELVQYPVVDPVDPDPADSNRIIFTTQFKASDGMLFTEILKGYSYYRCTGGRGGGCGTRWAITSGSITVQ